MAAAKVYGMSGHGDDDTGHAPVSQVHHLTLTISTCYFPVSCVVVEGHCSRLILKKDMGEEVEEISGEENVVVVMAEALIATAARTLKTDCVLRDSLDQRQGQKIVCTCTLLKTEKESRNSCVAVMTWRMHFCSSRQFCWQALQGRSTYRCMIAVDYWGRCRRENG